MTREDNNFSRGHDGINCKRCTYFWKVSDWFLDFRFLRTIKKLENGEYKLESFIAKKICTLIDNSVEMDEKIYKMSGGSNSMKPVNVKSNRINTWKAASQRNLGTVKSV